MPNISRGSANKLRSAGEVSMRRAASRVVFSTGIVALSLLGLPQGAGGAPERFVLTNQHGQRVAESDLRGSFVLLYFGYTYCPDVCALHLNVMSNSLKLLAEEAAARVQPVFITIDPERDSPEVLAAYAAHFHPRLLTLTGTPEEVAVAANNFGVKFTRAPVQSGHTYLLDHVTYMYLLDPDGRLLLIFPSAKNAADVAEVLRKHLTTE